MIKNLRLYVDLLQTQKITGISRINTQNPCFNEAPGGGRFVVLCGYTRYRRDIDMANIIAVIWDCGDCLVVKG